MKRIVKVLSVFIAGLFFVFSASAVTKQIVILNTGDIHECSNSKNPKLFQLKIKEFVDKMRKTNSGRVILVDAGDVLTQVDGKRGHFPRSDWAGRHKDVYDWARTMRYDAMVLGNHDFVGDGGVAFLQKYPDLPFVCANLKYPGVIPSPLEPPRQPIPPYRIITKAGVKIAIIGIADQDHIDYHFKKDSAGKLPDKEKLTALPVDGPDVKSMIKCVERKFPDFIIILSHNWDHVDTINIANLLITRPFIIVGGHSHHTIPAKNKEQLLKKPYLIKSGAFGDCIGRTIVTYDTNKKTITKVSAKNIPMK